MPKAQNPNPPIPPSHVVRSAAFSLPASFSGWALSPGLPMIATPSGPPKSAEETSAVRFPLPVTAGASAGRTCPRLPPCSRRARHASTPRSAVKRRRTRACATAACASASLASLLRLVAGKPNALCLLSVLVSALGLLLGKVAVVLGWVRLTTKQASRAARGELFHSLCTTFSRVLNSSRNSRTCLHLGCFLPGPGRPGSPRHNPSV